MCRPGAGLFGSVVNYAAGLGRAGKVPVGSLLLTGGVGTAAGYAFCHLGGNCRRPSTSASVSMYSYILADSIRRATTECQSAVDITQAIQIQGPSTDVTVDSLGCYECLRMVDLLYRNREKMVTKPEQRPNVGDPCRFACRTNVVDSATQSASFTLGVDCGTAVDLKTRISSVIDQASDSAIKDVTDVSGELGRILSSDANCVKADIKQIVETRLEKLDITKLLQETRALQTILIKGESVAASGPAQALSITLLASLIEQNKVFDDVTSTEISLLQQEVVTQNAGLLDLLTNMTGTITDSVNLLGSTMARMILAAAAVAVGAILIYVIWFFLL